MLGHVNAVWSVILTKIPWTFIILLHIMYILIEQEYMFLANRPKITYAMLIKNAFKGISTFFYIENGHCLWI